LETVDPTPDVAFLRARAHLDLGQWKEAADVIVAQCLRDPGDWRTWWWQGVVELAGDDARAAREEFDRVAAEMPGELAPLLALGAAAEHAGDPATAARCYDLVSAVDPGFASASLGLARVKRTQGDKQAAVAALRRVASHSSAYSAAQTALCGLLAEPAPGVAPDAGELAAASDVLARLDADAAVKAGLTRGLLASALDMVRGGAPPSNGARVAGVVLEEAAVRSALERTCRVLAKLAQTEAERIALVDEANSYRPRSLL
jgi:serine/threonine-protein kinase PknG